MKNMNANTIEKTELNKILSLVAEYATLSATKERIKGLCPQTGISEVKRTLTLTEECTTLLFEKGAPKIELFPTFSDELERAQKGSTLSCGELLSISMLLRSARIAHTSIVNAADDSVREMLFLANKIYFDAYLEEDISEKILNDTEISDHASEKLYSVRREIRLLNEKIRSRLSEYLTGQEGKYLQDSIVTMRGGRYVLPVKAEYKRSIKGFVHDKSATGATFFIEPEEILEMNNELKSLAIDEKEEMERILKELSFRVGSLYDRLILDISLLETIDEYYAKAEYGYKISAIKPTVNEEGKISFSEGRHPLIDKKKVVPVSLSLGKDYRFLLISGPNTGGKTVTLKMVGLFCLMAACGLFIPAKRAEIAVFEKIFCDIGDLQSIEENLSTFSSHITNVSDIVNQADEKTLVLLDELGGGTDPEEGQALAKAVVNFLLSTNCTGVLTTHYTALKEFAFSKDGIENACMEFDSNTLKPLYVIKIGLPGSSNALAISRRLGLKECILNDALSNLSSDAQKFENIVRTAEESRVKADETLQECNRLKREWQEKLA
ncbi:MAG: endonuclease MutS2, partial [Clostridia bacterium]|nr:endonuclease MutS2 [Clostridia bacterium]